MSRRLSRFVKGSFGAHHDIPRQVPVPAQQKQNKHVMASTKTEYPRPDFERSALRWESLNGPWDFLFDDLDSGLAQAWHHGGLPSHAPTQDKPSPKRTIQVPFVFQSPASGIDERGVHQVLWYERSIEDVRNSEEIAEGYKLLVRFGAVDWHAKVWLDGQYIGEHQGGHVPFDLDLTDAMRLDSSSSRRLTVRVFDSAYDLTQPRGKQFWGPKPESIWYTPSSGIWQPVWLESVPSARIVDGSYGTILRSNDIDRGILDARVCVSGRSVGRPLAIEIQSSLGGLVIGSGRKDLPRDEDFVRFFELNMRLSREQIDRLPSGFRQGVDGEVHWKSGVALWSPECPFLYDLTIRLLEPSNGCIDEIRTTVGMRSLNWTTGDGTFRLNGKPYFQALFLDQGYWPER